VRFKLEGIAALDKALRKFDRDLGKKYAEGIGAVARLIWSESQDVTPVDTGALRASGDYWVEGSGWATVGYVGYGGPVEGFERVPAVYTTWVHDAPQNRRWLEDTATEQADEAGYLLYQYLSGV